MARVKNLIYKVEIPLYKQTVHVTFSKEAYKKKSGYEIPDDVAGVANRDGLMIWLPLYNGCINVADMAHEAFHIADFIADKVGLFTQYETGNEHMAYLIGHISQRVFDCLDIENEVLTNG